MEGDEQEGAGYGVKSFANVQGKHVQGVSRGKVGFDSGEQREVCPCRAFLFAESVLFEVHRNDGSDSVNEYCRKQFVDGRQERDPTTVPT